MTFDFTLSSKRVVWVLGVLSALLYAHLGYVEVVVRHDRPVQIDELFFATCAARSSHLGQWLSSGCHDNKGPVIYVIYGLLHRLAGVYNYEAYKSCALLIGLVLAALAGRLAARLAGLAIAGVCCFALMLQIFVLDPWLVALKPELVGMTLLLAAIALVDAGPRHPGRVAVAGFLLGLAFLTKQTFLFAAVSLFLALFGLALAGEPGRRALLWKQVLGFAVGGVSALTLAALIFYVRGDLMDALSSVFIYPTVYASSTTDGSILKRALFKFVEITEALQPFASLLVFAAAGAVWSLRAKAQGGSKRLALLLAAVWMGVLAALLIAPVFLRFHLLPLLVFAAVFGGMMLSRLAVSLVDGGDRGAAWAVSAGVATLSALVVLSAWGGQYANPLRDEARWSQFKVADSRGAYGYAIGTWPEFYVQSGLIPASGVMYPTALPGAPATWSYRPPDPSSWKGARLVELQARNAKQLSLDFAETPPKYILVNPAMARATGSQQVTDIAVLNTYLADRCQPSGAQAKSDREYRFGTLYVCDVNKSP